MIPDNLPTPAAFRIGRVNYQRDPGSGPAIRGSYRDIGRTDDGSRGGGEESAATRIGCRAGAQGIAPPAATAGRAEVENGMVSAGFYRCRFPGRKTPQQSGYRANVFSGEIVSDQGPLIVGKSDLDPHLVSGFIPIHLPATKVALALKHRTIPKTPAGAESGIKQFSRGAYYLVQRK